MIKKITAVFTAFFLIFQAVPTYAVGKYYTERNLPKITSEDLVYKTVDISNLEKNISKLDILVKQKGAGKRISSLVNDSLNTLEEVQNAHTLAMIGYDRNCNDENEKKFQEASEISVRAAELISEVIYCVYDSDYKEILGDIFGDVELALAFALPEDDDISDLLNKELELENKYSEISDDRDACANLFLELLLVRNEIAHKYGYDNYADYANEIVYGREYTDSEIAEFYSSVVKYISPIYENAWKSLFMTYSDDMPMSEDDVLLNARAIIKNINPELGEGYEYLIANNLYDIRISDKKNPVSGSYTALLPKANVPFLFLNPEDSYEEDGVLTVMSLIHEFGHFSSMLHTPDTGIPYESLLVSPCIDTTEIHSQGLEVLAERYYGRVFGSNAPSARYYMLTSICASILDGCLMNEWQETVYKMENPTLDKINDAFSELGEKYYGFKCSHDEEMDMWTAIPHNYKMPMYYISYALSGVTALGIYSDSITDYEGAVDTYMQISGEGIYQPFSEVSRDCGLKDIYDEDIISTIAYNIKKVYAMEYSDVDDFEWYSPYTYVVSNILNVRAENMFMPDTPITRGEFVGALGRMYDYYVGIDEEYESDFTDLVSNEDKEYIAWAEAKGIVSGYDDNTFGVNDTLTREQAVAILFRLSETAKEEDEDMAYFVDMNEISDWAKSGAVWASVVGIIDGRDGDVFDPRASITRAETAKIVAGYIVREY